MPQLNNKKRANRITARTIRLNLIDFFIKPVYSQIIRGANQKS
tara:strand:+ start:109 stop:237 length:129 start_codon:yes stop_codon:yes gene_type:complete